MSNVGTLCPLPLLCPENTLLHAPRAPMLPLCPPAGGAGPRAARHCAEVPTHSGPIITQLVEITNVSVSSRHSWKGNLREIL